MYSKFRDQVYELTIPSGTAAGAVVEFTLQLLSEYKRCIGYAVQQISNANNEAYSVALELESGEGVQDFVHYLHLTPGSGAPMSDRYARTEFSSSNVKIRLKTKMIVAATATIRVQFILRQSM